MVRTSLAGLLLLLPSSSLADRYVFEPAPRLAMPAAERHLPPPLLLLLPSLLLIFCLDGEVRAVEEGGGLLSSSPRDNGHGEPPASEPTAPGRVLSASAPTAGKQTETSFFVGVICAVEKREGVMNDSEHVGLFVCVSLSGQTCLRHRYALQIPNKDDQLV